MKVLHLLALSRPSVNGYSSRSDAILQNLKYLGVETCQLTSQKHDQFDELEETIDGIKYYRTTKAKGFFIRIPILSYIDQVRHMTNRALEIIRIERPDVIHAHSPMLNGLVALNLRKRTGIPILYEVRAFWEDAAVDTGKIKQNGMQYKLIKSIEQYVFKRVDKISCICEGLKNEIINRKINPDKLIVAPNAVDLTKFIKISEKNIILQNKYNLSEKKILAFLGSFFKYEGIEFVIKAIPEIAKTIPNIHLLLVGGGNETDNLKKLVNQLDLHDFVTFTGRVNYNEINEYYSLADMLVFPRENIRLTQLVTPLKPLEAMAQGIPVAASDIGGHREMIEHEKTGVLFEAENPNALATCVVNALTNKKLLVELRDNGFNYVENIRNWKTTASIYPPVYKELLEKFDIV